MPDHKNAVESLNVWISKQKLILKDILSYFKTIFSVFLNNFFLLHLHTHLRQSGNISRKIEVTGLRLGFNQLVTVKWFALSIKWMCFIALVQPLSSVLIDWRTVFTYELDVITEVKSHQNYFCGIQVTWYVNINRFCDNIPIYFHVFQYTVLREKCPKMEFFLVCIIQHLNLIRKNTERKKHLICTLLI